MCGIAGFWDLGPATADAPPVLRRMTDAIRHRGPDDEGHWFDTAAGVALGHRRLSILDLSPEGHQPMVSADGRWVLVYNGEIYNWQALRTEETGHGARWRGHSDTEVFLAAIARLGVVEATRRCHGMFAYALWDRAERRLHLGRDALGEKPLYFGVAGGTLLFGSELKALRAHPAFRGTVDRGALTLLLRYGYIPAPHAIYDGIRKVAPGTIVSFRAGGVVPEVTTYWSLLEAAERGRAAPFRGSREEALAELATLLRGVVGREMVADVPLGAFLSGGVDSSLIVALMQAESPRPVRTFTIGFHEAGFNEAEHAKAVARHLGTDHTELYVTADDALAVVPKLPGLFDEPMADPSGIPTYLVAALARRHVTVSLSGDGGDELFGGYDRYLLAERWWRRRAPVPGLLRQALGGALRGLEGARVRRLAGVLSAETAEGMYRDLVAQWQAPEQVVLGGVEPATALTDRTRWVPSAEVVRRWMALDTVTYLPDDVLVKVDRAAMAVSLETRAPLLDHAVVEFAWRLPLGYKVRDGRGKALLRELLHRYVPPALVERPKMGFGVPVGRWLTGPLAEWAEALLAPARLKAEGFFDPAAVERVWRAHRSGAASQPFMLWDVLMFQAWLEAQAVRPAVAA